MEAYLDGILKIVRDKFTHLSLLHRRRFVLEARNAQMQNVGKLSQSERRQFANPLSENAGVKML